MVVISGLLWVSVWILNKHMMSITHVTPGISLIFFPAGFRLLILLLFGGWGALGIFLFEPLLFLDEFGSGTALQMFATSAISGFSPWLVILVFCRLAHVRTSLAGLRPVHLPFLALAVSLVTPLLFNLLFVLMGMHPASEFMRNYLAMATGDFLGCVIVIGLIKLLASLRTLRQD